MISLFFCSAQITEFCGLQILLFQQPHIHGTRRDLKEGFIQVQGKFFPPIQNQELVNKGSY